MWGHLCFSKPAAPRASTQAISSLKSRRPCRLERNLSNPLPLRGQPAGQGRVRTRPVPARGRGYPLPPAGLRSICGGGLCARWGCVYLCAYTWLSVGAERIFKSCKGCRTILHVGHSPAHSSRSSNSGLYPLHPRPVPLQRWGFYRHLTVAQVGVRWRVCRWGRLEGGSGPVGSVCLASLHPGCPQPCSERDCWSPSCRDRRELRLW